MPFFSSFTGSFTSGRRKPISIGVGGGGGGGQSVDFTTLTLQTTIDNPNPVEPETSDLFGIGISLSGTTVLIGAMGEDETVSPDDSGRNAGKAYLYDITDGSLLHTIDNADADGNPISDNFGRYVAIDGDYFIISGTTENSFSGAVYVYDTNTATLLRTITNPNAYGTSDNDYFGIGLDLSGTTAIVGAWQEDDAGGTSSGKVYVFDVTDGSLLQTFDNPNSYGTSADDRFGLNSATDGTLAIVSAHYEDEAGHDRSGKAYIFNVSTGALVHTLNNPNNDSAAGAIGDQFGQFVDIDGDYAVASSIREANNTGIVYVFNTSDGSLARTIQNPSGTSGDTFGDSVRLQGNYLLVGASGASGNAGKAYLFNVTDGSLLQTIDNPNADPAAITDLFGTPCDIDNEYIVFGTAFEGGGGKAYAFKGSA